MCRQESTLAVTVVASLCTAMCLSSLHGVSYGDATLATSLNLAEIVSPLQIEFQIEESMVL